MVGIDIGDGAGRASRGTGRIAAAQIALGDLAGIGVVVHGAEGAGNRTDLAADANVFDNFFGAGLRVDDDGLNRASMQTPGFLTLRAGVRREATFIVEGKDFDTGLAGIEYGLILVRAGHFTLKAAGAKLGLEL